MRGAFRNALTTILLVVELLLIGAEWLFYGLARVSLWPAHGFRWCAGMCRAGQLTIARFRKKAGGA